jgi:hypothetical protein
MIALCRNKSIQIRLQENTSKLMKFIKSPQETAEIAKQSPCQIENQIAKGLIWHDTVIHHNYTRAIVLMGALWSDTSIISIASSVSYIG